MLMERATTHVTKQNWICEGAAPALRRLTREVDGIASPLQTARCIN